MLDFPRAVFNAQRALDTNKSLFDSLRVMPEKHKTQTRVVNFAGFDGSLLAASLDFPVDVTPRQYAIMSHCFTCTRQTLTTARISRGLAQSGIGVLRFDFTGLGDSEGVFADSHFRSMVRDIECAAEFLARHFQPASILMGHSMGGTASLAASQDGCSALSKLSKLITIASPAYPAHVLHHFGGAMPRLRQGLAAEILVAGQAYPVKPSFVDDVETYDMSLQMQNCDIPIMAARAGNDALVGPEAAEQILAFTRAETRLIEIAEADHLFSNRDHADGLLRSVLSWLE